MHFKWTYHLFAIALLFTPLASGAPLGSSFTYQGRLDDDANGATGNYDLRFELFDLETAGNSVAAAKTNPNVAVVNGVFSTSLDFGSAAFSGDARWLQIGVRTNGALAFVPLTPRQKITATPYAIAADTARNLAGVLPSSALGGTYSSAVTLNNSGNSFAGNGAGLLGVNAITLAGFGPASFWQLNGNGGTTAGVNFLGTTDNQPLELKVNNSRALRIEPNATSPNLIGG